jgi:hypothetical protein
LPATQLQGAEAELSRYSRDVFELVLVGKVDRLRTVLNEQPELARLRYDNGATPLMQVRSNAREIIVLFLAHGADRHARLDAGRSVADLLCRRGFEAEAKLLEASPPIASGS